MKKYLFENIGGNSFVIAEEPSIDGQEQMQNEIYTQLEKIGFRREGNDPNTYVEFYLNGFATVQCGVQLDKGKVHIERYYDSERLAVDYNKVYSVPLPPEYSKEFVDKIVKMCGLLKKSIEGDESLFGGMDDLQEEIDNDAPYGVVDSQTGKVVFRTTYKNRNKARQFADKKDNEYGAYRYRAQRLNPDQ